MFDQEMFSDLVSSSFLATLDQCRYECIAKKPTMFLYSKANFADIQLWCDPVSGPDACKAGHVPIAGKLGNGKFATASFAAYPAALNRAIAEVILDAISGLPQSVLILYGIQVSNSHF